MSVPTYKSEIGYETQLHIGLGKIWRTRPSGMYEDDEKLHGTLITKLETFQKYAQKMKDGGLEWKIDFPFERRTIVIIFRHGADSIETSIADINGLFVVEFLVDE